MKQVTDLLDVQVSMDDEDRELMRMFPRSRQTVLNDMLKIHQTTPGNGVRVCWEHPYYRMLNQRPNRFMAASTFWSTMELCRNHYGTL